MCPINESSLYKYIQISTLYTDLKTFIPNLTFTKLWKVSIEHLR